MAAIQNTAKKTSSKTLDIGKIKALRNAGWSYEKIGDEMGVTGQTIFNHLKKEAENDLI